MHAKLTMLLGTLVVALCAMVAFANPASAHGGHARAPAAITTQADGSGLVQVQQHVQDRAAKGQAYEARLALDAIGGLGDDNSQHPQNVCCGSILCHAGTIAAAVPVAAPYRASEKVALPAVLVLARLIGGGIERPPRAA